MRFLLLLLAAANAATYIFNVGATGTVVWDVTGNITGMSPQINARTGDTIIFNVAAPTHVFSIHQTAGSNAATDRYSLGITPNVRRFAGYGCFVFLVFHRVFSRPS